MPLRFRSRLLAFALAAVAFGCAAPDGLARLDGPPRRERPAAKPTIGERAAKVALEAIGIPYRWGGSSPSSGFDCSGLVLWAYSRNGVAVPHSSYALYGLGRPVRRSALKAGDVLFFSGLGHVGMYVGRGRMVHAPQSGRTVEVVALNRSNYGLRLVGARRLVS
ncbi:MAG TPA: C40 family peptidase [Gaiellaceae bacterium]|nr:C40 family peptidase [Gaiellaceae bacterium]